MLKDKILRSIAKLGLDLRGRRVLTEAATGNYVVTPVIAAAAGADVTAFTRDSNYGSIADVEKQTDELAGSMGLSGKIDVVDDLGALDLAVFDIVTNCGFLRPMNREFIARLSPRCVIPLVYEPWEVRDEDIDLEACAEKGIKVYGPNEADPRLRTMEYIGYTALHFLLGRKLSPFSAKVLIIGCEHFTDAISRVLERNDYTFCAVTTYDEDIDVSEFNAVIVAEFADDRLVIGPTSSAYIHLSKISPDAYVIHIAGNVDLDDAEFAYTPKAPRPYRYMSYTTDFIDPQAVVDLHCAGLKVGEGMLKAQQRGLCGVEYKQFMENEYPALACDNVRFW